jgi:hypothetical protein
MNSSQQTWAIVVRARWACCSGLLLLATLEAVGVLWVMGRKSIALKSLTFTAAVFITLAALSVLWPYPEPGAPIPIENIQRNNP